MPAYVSHMMQSQSAGTHEYLKMLMFSNKKDKSKKHENNNKMVTKTLNSTTLAYVQRFRHHCAQLLSHPK